MAKAQEEVDRILQSRLQPTMADYGNLRWASWVHEWKLGPSWKQAIQSSLLSLRCCFTPSFTSLFSRRQSSRSAHAAPLSPFAQVCDALRVREHEAVSASARASEEGLGARHTARRLW